MVGSNLGRKIFFVYPHSVVRNELVHKLLDQEYEIYLINDHNFIKPICETYSNPIFFINIDEGLQEHEWEYLISSMKKKNYARKARFGIFTYNDNENLSKKFLMDIGITCGFITLKLGMSDSTEIITKTLKANEARGKRKYLGTTCPSRDSRLNFIIQGVKYYGSITSISSIGMSIMLKNNFELRIKERLDDIQLKLKGSIVNVSAVVLGKQKSNDGKTIYIVLFDSTVKDEERSKIRLYISKTLQNKLESELNYKLLQWHS